PKAFFSSLNLGLHKQHSGESLCQELQVHIDQGFSILLTASSASQVERLKHLTEAYGLRVKTLSKLSDFSEGLKPGIYGLQGVLEEGFVHPSSAKALVTDQEIFGKRQRRVRSKAKTVELFSSFEELERGDYVVHEEHGLGRYEGLQSLDFGGRRQDYLLLYFQDEDKLYVPVYRLNQLSRYSSLTSHEPVLDKMGGTRWLKTKVKIKTQLKSMAGELLKLYAERQSLEGYAFSSGGALYEEFEAKFPFEETPDQLKAIREVEKDMSETRPMDRLICGDVGFGKTEVAMRAAFRAVLDGKQVAVLVPTTVLALQHERSFKERFKDFAVKISSISRFVSLKEQKHRLEELAKGHVDIMIGTTALLGKKVIFKDLGLLIVDEEQHFGVAQKEKIKQFKKQCDVLALSATPIPRTLNMSLSGIRQISIISTPPVDRQAIQTFVAPYNEALIKEAIERELLRGGQVYFIHNRVQSLKSLEDRLKTLVPQATVRS
ncbi:MAG: DEAD/DEAH box helicase, partial [Deltaproteobacteria bacterium]|nr:DEAD/DEAH box helicase [Deltaproteobacteria bacterium]